jgi:putative endonuclease
MADRRYAVAIIASRRNGALHVGVTKDLAKRANAASGAGSQFAAKNEVETLVWYEHDSDINDAIGRERQLKKWERRRKLELIESFNPSWARPYETLNA